MDDNDSDSPEHSSAAGDDEGMDGTRCGVQYAKHR